MTSPSPGQAPLDFDPRLSPLEGRYRAWRSTPAGAAVYREVVERAKRLRAAGWRRFSIAALWESIRFDRSVELGPDADGYRLNNSWRSRLAREVLSREPELDGFFETRELAEK